MYLDLNNLLIRSKYQFFIRNAMNLLCLYIYLGFDMTSTIIAIGARSDISGSRQKRIRFQCERK